MKFLSEIEDLMSMEGSYKKYRHEVGLAIPPVIPYMYASPVLPFSKKTKNEFLLLSHKH